MRRQILLLLASTLLLPSLCAAQVSKPVKILTGLPAGGTVELVARVYMDALRVALGVPVVLENRVGASGLIALEAMVAAPRDGATLLFAPNGAVTLVTQLIKASRVDPFRDVVPVARVAHGGFVLGANSSVSFDSVAGFIAAAKTHPEVRNMGVTPGTIPDLITSLFENEVNIKFQHVPYKGSGQVVVDLVGGQILAAFIAPTEGAQYARSGRIRLLAQTSATRSALLPGVPTLRESGVALDMDSWYGFYAPGGTPAEALQRTAAALLEATRAPEVRERLAHLWVEPSGMAGPELVQLMHRDFDTWTRAIRLAGIERQ